MALGNKEVLDLKFEANDLKKEQDRIARRIKRLREDHERHVKKHRLRETDIAMEQLNECYARDKAIDSRMAWIKTRLLGSWGNR